MTDGSRRSSSTSPSMRGQAGARTSCPRSSKRAFQPSQLRDVSQRPWMRTMGGVMGPGVPGVLPWGVARTFFLIGAEVKVCVCRFATQSPSGCAREFVLVLARDGDHLLRPWVADVPGDD